MSEPVTRTDALPTADQVAEFAAGRIRKLQHGVIGNRSESVATLARLRRAAGKEPGSVPDVLEYTLGPELTWPGAPNSPTHAETAAHLALTLYAIHQQALTERMHRDGGQFGLGRAARRLIPGDLGERPHPVLRRFQALGTSADIGELAHHARGLVQQLRGQRIPLDYGRLARQLMRWQQPGGPEQVRLVWGREFFAHQKPEQEQEG
ncbi:type I-E CRISPR-associated protein Cse2/CasB [Amycolatopsis cihanbeyliensis]|uniref:CRISPR-associated Cse2 family protein n=1 Tax=Amycolatopsis cihanbeyliensis TaxID=1128664 RepID=A0A542DRT2_AMYCI|nr:type I-E CRISPR-associated protein Cse2/CasB [Amycolatopsis cihanbeyliensis]TQJ05833.1 CRISPR-associated Cse2 family protein [Amycolatopsis cihanbeyliensis]